MKSPLKKNVPKNLINFQHPDQFGNWLGYQILKFDTRNHTAVTELKIRNDHLSPAGRVHGGVVSAFFDFSCGAAVFTTLGAQDACSTVELKVNYLRPLEEGDLLISKTRVVFRGKKLCVVQGEVFRGKKKSPPVAVGLATFNILSKTGEPPRRHQKIQS